MYLLEFILQAVFYGKSLPKLSFDVFVYFVGCSESPMPRVQLKIYPYLCWNKGIIFRIWSFLQTVKISSKNSNKYTEKL